MQKRKKDAEKENDWNKIMAGKKFDVIFSNPPYNDNLDLKILEHLFKISENIVFVHPSSFLLDNKNINAIFKRIKDSSFLEKVILFWGNKLFNIGLFVPVCISYWNTKKSNNKININDTAFIKKIYNVNDINDISMHGNLNNIKSFLNNIQKFIEKNGSMLSNKAIFYDKNKNNIKFSAVRGHPSPNSGILDDFFSFLSMDIKNNLNIKDDDIKKCLIFSFNSENERTNFISYCKTKFSRFCLSFYKINNNLNRGETAIVPWLDFTKEWDDAKLCKEFGISEELWNYINNFIPDYYNDYKSGFEEENK